MLTTKQTKPPGCDREGQYMPVILPFGKLRQGNHYEFYDSLGFSARPYLKTSKHAIKQHQTHIIFNMIP